ncbi:MAG: 2-oxoglutarate and iron-dependent oxygenase domain-containing protein [Pirellulales bacterium]
MSADFSAIPIIDVSPLLAAPVITAPVTTAPLLAPSPITAPHVADAAAKHQTAAQLNTACRESGFFYVVGHGVDADLQHRLLAQAREFFARPVAEKMQIEMSRGGKAWRGYFRVGDELTSGLPDQKEGVYFGQETAADHPLVQSGTPLYGPNLFPEHPGELRATVLQYMAALTKLGHSLLAGIALGLGLPEHYFADHGTRDPLTLFRIFNYPPPSSAELWGVGEHTDYGLLTILLQDDVGGLEVKSRSQWVAAPPLANSFICNIGDMLDRMTRGVYRSTPHRVRNLTNRHRLSFPFFFDPNFFADVRPIELPSGETAPDDRGTRWDKSSVHIFQGTYGDYLLNKVGKAFPGLKDKVL